MENCPRPIIINNKIKWKSNSLLQERRYREARLNRLANAERIKIRKKLRVMGSGREEMKKKAKSRRRVISASGAFEIEGKRSEA